MAVLALDVIRQHRATGAPAPRFLGTPAEERAMTQAAQDGDPLAMLYVYDWAERAFAKHRGSLPWHAMPAVTSDDYRQELWIALYMALGSWCPDKGLFRHYGQTCLRHSMNEWAGRHRGPVGLTRHSRRRVQREGPHDALTRAAANALASAHPLSGTVRDDDDGISPAAVQRTPEEEAEQRERAAALSALMQCVAEGKRLTTGVLHGVAGENVDQAARILTPTPRAHLVALNVEAMQTLRRLIDLLENAPDPDADEDETAMHYCEQCHAPTPPEALVPIDIMVAQGASGDPAAVRRLLCRPCLRTLGLWNLPAASEPYPRQPAGEPLRKASA